MFMNCNLMIVSDHAQRSAVPSIALPTPPHLPLHVLPTHPLPLIPALKSQCYLLVCDRDAHKHITHNTCNTVQYLLASRCRDVSPSLLCSDGDAPKDKKQSTIDCKLLQIMEKIKMDVNEWVRVRIRVRVRVN